MDRETTVVLVAFCLPFAILIAAFVADRILAAKRASRCLESHEWNGCECSRCGMANHDWLGDTCVRCGKSVPPSSDDDSWDDGNHGPSYRVG